MYGNCDAIVDVPYESKSELAVIYKVTWICVRIYFSFNRTPALHARWCMCGKRANIQIHVCNNAHTGQDGTAHTHPWHSQYCLLQKMKMIHKHGLKWFHTHKLIELFAVGSGRKLNGNLVSHKSGQSTHIAAPAIDPIYFGVCRVEFGSMYHFLVVRFWLLS